MDSNIAEASASFLTKDVVEPRLSPVTNSTANGNSQNNFLEEQFLPTQLERKLVDDYSCSHHASDLKTNIKKSEMTTSSIAANDVVESFLDLEMQNAAFNNIASKQGRDIKDEHVDESYNCPNESLKFTAINQRDDTEMKPVSSSQAFLSIGEKSKPSLVDQPMDLELETEHISNDSIQDTSEVDDDGTCSPASVYFPHNRSGKIKKLRVGSERVGETSIGSGAKGEEENEEVGMMSMKGNDDKNTQPKIQYVFINKPAKERKKKKKLAVVCKKGFRHSHKKGFDLSALIGKLSKGNNIKFLKELAKSGLANTKPEPKQGVSKKTGVKTTSRAENREKTTANKKNERKRKQRGGEEDVIPAPNERKRKQRGEDEEVMPPPKAGRKSKKDKEAVSLKIKISKKKKEGKKSRGKDKERKVSKTHSYEKRVQKKRTINESLKESILAALESPGVTIESVSDEFCVAQSVIERLVEKENKKRIAEATKAYKGRSKRSIEKRRKAARIEEGEDDDEEEEGEDEKMRVKQELRENEDDDDDENNRAWSGGDDDDDDDETVKNAREKLAAKVKREKYRCELTLSEKLIIINELQASGSKVSAIAKKYGLSSSSVSRLKRKRHTILSKTESGDVCLDLKRTRDCKAPELDKALLKWYRTIEATLDGPFSLSNPLLKQKSHDISIAMGCSYLPTINWILRWKYRHKITGNAGRVETQEELENLDKKVDIGQVLAAVDEQIKYHKQLLENKVKEEEMQRIVVCEHCGVSAPKRSKKRKIHAPQCPLHIKRTDLTLGQKVMVLRALDKPGVKIVQVARKFDISSSAASRIQRDKIDILARYNEGYLNMERKRSRVSDHPDVEKLLCDWYRNQAEMGLHVPTLVIKEKAKDIGRDVGKPDFNPSDSWVFRWRKRNNILGPVEIAQDLDMDCEEDDEKEEDGGAAAEEKKKARKRKPKPIKVKPVRTPQVFPKSVMCEKCGCVSMRSKNNCYMGSMRHSKGCPMIKERNEVTYENRIKILKDLEETGATIVSVARKYGVSSSSVSRMNKKRALILAKGPARSNLKRIRECKEPEIAQRLYEWYQEKLAEGVHPTGTKLKEKASLMAKEEGREFKVSTGWIGRWKNRYDLNLKDHANYNRKEKQRLLAERMGNQPHDNVVTSKRKPSKTRRKRKHDAIEPVNASNDFDANSGCVQTINVTVESNGQTIQTPQMFFAPRYQNPWDLVHNSVAAAQGVVTSAVDEPQVTPAAYTFNAINSNPTPHPLFHHTFESFALSNSYPVLNPDVNRDFLQQDEKVTLHQAPHPHPNHQPSYQNNNNIPPTLNSPPFLVPNSNSASTSSPSSNQRKHNSNIHHPLPPTDLVQNLSIPQSSTLANLRKSFISSHSHTRNNDNDNGVSANTNNNHRAHNHHQTNSPHLSNSNLQRNENNTHRQQQFSSPHSSMENDEGLAEALKMMSSFAMRKSLGADVQAALRTIEMSMRNTGKSSPPFHS